MDIHGRVRKALADLPFDPSAPPLVKAIHIITIHRRVRRSLEDEGCWTITARIKVMITEEIERQIGSIWND